MDMCLGAVIRDRRKAMKLMLNLVVYLLISFQELKELVTRTSQLKRLTQLLNL